MTTHGRPPGVRLKWDRRFRKGTSGPARRAVENWLNRQLEQRLTESVLHGAYSKTWESRMEMPSFDGLAHLILDKEPSRP